MRRAPTLAALGLLCLYAGQGSLACSIDVPSTLVEIGEHEIGTAPALTEVIQTVSVTCPAGVNYRLYPRSTSTNSNLALAMTFNGSANGSIYLMMRRLDDTLMRSADTATHITGTGTGAPQEHQVKLFLAGSSSTPTMAINRLGDFDQSYALYRVRRLDNNATFDSSAQQITGRVVGQCTIASGGDIDFGTIESKQLETQYDQLTTLTIQCSTSINYSVYADSPGSTHSWITNSLRPVTEKPNDFFLYFRIRPAGGGTWLLISKTMRQIFTATGSPQVYDLKAELVIASGNKIGAFNLTIQPTITF